MLVALDAGVVSSVELVDMHLEPIDEHDAALNAIVVRTIERARESAVVPPLVHPSVTSVLFTLEAVPAYPPPCVDGRL